MLLQLFPNCVESLSVALKETGISAEIVVADFASCDEAVAREAIEESGIPYQWISLDGGFCRGLGLNMAAAEIRAPIVFFLDADMLLSPGLLERMVEVVRDGVAFFPWCLSFREPEHISVWERREGWGMCGITRDDLRRVPKVVERGEWGWEDEQFRESLREQGIEIVRELGEGLYHQWHPSDRGWKNRFSRVRERVRAKNNCILKFSALHPRWRDVIQLFENGRFNRSTGEGGCYVLEEGVSVTLYWDSWDAERVFWDAAAGAYIDTEKGFKLKAVKG